MLPTACLGRGMRSLSSGDRPWGRNRTKKATYPALVLRDESSKEVQELYRGLINTVSKRFGMAHRGSSYAAVLARSEEHQHPLIYVLHYYSTTERTVERGSLVGAFMIHTFDLATRMIPIYIQLNAGSIVWTTMSS